MKLRKFISWNSRNVKCGGYEIKSRNFLVSSVVIPSGGKEMCTDLGCVAANGYVSPHMSSRLQGLELVHLLVCRWSCRRRELSNWCCMDWKGQPWPHGSKRALITHKTRQEPVLVLFNGHSSHITVDLITTAKAHTAPSLYAATLFTLSAAIRRCVLPF